ncbi:unnamed protein product [Nesidiocoris tenuis]|uniref:Uncharacterized protein n=1 Tax=Nesidiocoris tenuis TaxID=355587 RepID=A0A6H5GN19_9HEMI|nr:unnamed protein product [Nesidiocoris tenuis]
MNFSHQTIMNEFDLVNLCLMQRANRNTDATEGSNYLRFTTGTEMRPNHNICSQLIVYLLEGLATQTESQTKLEITLLLILKLKDRRRI